MIKDDNTMIIRGCLPYRTKKEKKAAFKSLKQEFQDNVKIIFGKGILTYSAEVNRNSYL